MIEENVLKGPLNDIETEVCMSKLQYFFLQRNSYLIDTYYLIETIDT